MPLKFALVALALARSLDAGTTCTALARGGVEGNPILPSSCRVAVGVQAGLTVGQDFGLTKLAVKHPKLAQIIAWSTVSVESYAGWHNAHIGR